MSQYNMVEKINFSIIKYKIIKIENLVKKNWKY